MGKSSPTPPPPIDPVATTGAQNAMNESQMRLNARINRPNQSTPFGTSTWSQGPDDQWSQSQTYDPRIISAYFNDLANTSELSNMGTDFAHGVHSTVFDDQTGYYKPFNPVNIPAAVDHIDPMTSGLARSIDTSGLNPIPGQNDFGAERQRVEDAMYGRQASRLNPQFADQQASLESQLANEGFARDSEAWKKEMDNFSRQKNDAYAGARQDAITGGGAEQSRLFGEALQARGQGFGEQQTQATFGNQANAQDFGQRFQSGQFQNAIRGQRYQEELTQRNQPFAEFMQMVHGSAPNLPQFSNPSQIQGMQPPDYLAAQGMAQQGAQNTYNQQVGQQNAQTSAMSSMAMMAMMAF